MIKVSRGYSGKQDNISKLNLPRIEVFENQYAQETYHVILITDELSAICPKTGLPDLYHLDITYSPTKWVAELKSFKYYITALRNVGIFHEHLANKILEDFVRAVHPSVCDIMLKAASRGGINTTVSRFWYQAEDGKHGTKRLLPKGVI